MEKDRAIAMLDETLARQNEVTPDDLEEICIQLRGDRDNLTALADAVVQLNVAGDDDEASEERERIVKELREQAGFTEETITQLEHMIDRLRRQP